MWFRPKIPTVTLSSRTSRAREEKDWEEAENLLAEGSTFESKIIGYNKGGLMVPLEGCVVSCRLRRSAWFAAPPWAAKRRNSAGARWLENRSRCV